MKRDLDLVREILIYVETEKTPNNWLHPKITNYNEPQISYHLKIMGEAGLIETRDLTTKTEFSYAVVDLKWAGHEFLDATRNNSIWEKVKSKLGENFTTAPLEIVKSIAISFLKDRFGIN